MSSGFQVVHVRVNDAATGQPTPVRVRFTDPGGRYLPPLGRSSNIPTGWNEQVGGNVMVDGKPFAYIDGTCEALLPCGVIHVEISKGPEYLRGGDSSTATLTRSSSSSVGCSRLECGLWFERCHAHVLEPAT